MHMGGKQNGSGPLQPAVDRGGSAHGLPEGFDKEAKEIYMLTGMEEYLKRHPKERADYERFLEKRKNYTIIFLPYWMFDKSFYLLHKPTQRIHGQKLKFNP